MPQKFNSGHAHLDLPLLAVLGTRTGAGSDGAALGALTVTNLDDCTQEDDSTSTFTDETTDASDAGASDVAMPDPFDTDDSLFFGYKDRFMALQVLVGTQGAGDDEVGETLFEYSTGTDTWSSLEAAAQQFTDSSTAFSAGTATYIISFIPPADWAKTPVDGGTSMYFVRMRGTADDVYNTTQPILSTAKCLPLSVGVGLTSQVGGVVQSIESHAGVASATNDDTELLIINITRKTACQYTWTGADVFDRDTSITELAGGPFRISVGDEIAVYTVQEDGTTEFDRAGLRLILR